jgi:dolichyl-phosphate-mannose--protein O-mannosyl transferase
MELSFKIYLSRLSRDHSDRTDALLLFILILVSFVPRFRLLGRPATVVLDKIHVGGFTD